LVTHRRSVFILDVENIQKIDQKIQEKEAHLFDIKPSRLPRSRGGRGEWAQEKSRQAFICYYLKKTQLAESFL